MGPERGWEIKYSADYGDTGKHVSVDHVLPLLLPRNWRFLVEALALNHSAHAMRRIQFV
jgi:hypothetical protein